MPGPQNAQDFIRALKASSDPPHAGGPFKIAIARQAWDNALLYVPNKAEAIVEWLLSRLLKDKSRERSENPIHDARYWTLLADILTQSNVANERDRSRTLRAWLVPLLNRIPIAPFILSYFELLPAGDHIDFVQYKVFSRCLSVLWPLAVPKFSPETLLECFGAVVRLGLSPVSDASRGSLQALDEFRALSAIVSSYRTCLTSSAAKRKQLYTIFLKKCLPCWLQLMPWNGENDSKSAPLTSDIYDAGIETMFGLEIMKQVVDHKHDAALAEALDAVLNDSPGVALRSLPRLFAAYVQSVKRHKGALFGQSFNQVSGHISEQVQLTAMAFYATCTALARAAESESSWLCHVSLLEVIEREQLLGVKDNEAKALLKQDGESAVEAIAGAWDEKHAVRTDSAVKMLATLTRIDYDLMSASFPVAFPRLVAVPNTTSSALRYLRLVLEYDSKVRNLPSTVTYITDAFSAHHLEGIPGGPLSAYRIASAGPLSSLPFMDELSRAVHGFLTPGQVLETVKEVSQGLINSYERFVEHEAQSSADRGNRPKKKRRKDGPPPEDRSEAEYHAVSFALIARTIVVVLQSLPLHTVTDDVRMEIERLIRNVYSTVASRALVDSFGKVGRLEACSWQLIMIGVLRMHYGLARASGLHLQLPWENEWSATMLARVSSDNMMPELAVEILRTLLHHCSLGALDTKAVLDRSLDYLETHVSDDVTLWSGKAHCLDTHSIGAVALLHLLADRWLPNFDAWATAKELQRLASVLVNAGREPPTSRTSSGLSAHDIVSRMLHDAQFWELLRLRDAFLAQLHERTGSLARIELSDILVHLTPETPRPAPDVVSQIACIYDVLLLTPPEYLPRAMHIEFLKRGFVADVVVMLTMRYARDAPLSERHLLAIREVLRRTIAHLGMVENIASREYLDYLLNHGIMNGGARTADKDLSSVTMDLINIIQGSLVRSSKKGNADSVVDIVQRYVQDYSMTSPSISKPASLLLIDTIVQNGSPSDFSQQCIDALRILHRRMLAYALPSLSSAVPEQEIPLDYVLLDVWSHLRTLGRWLGDEDDRIPAVGKDITRKLLSWAGEKQDLASLASVALSILLGELHNHNAADHREHVEQLVVAYITLTRICGCVDITDLESRLTSACRALPLESFSRLLDLVYDGLPLHRGLPNQDIANLIRFSTTLLRDAPDGTSKICQAHATECFNLFADGEQFTTSPVLRSQVVDFMVRQCSDRPASLKNVDSSSLWSLLRVLLAGSPEHESSSDATVFHGVINVLNALVRLRRDLVLNTLPHFGFVLRQLIFCLRSLRPQLGGKQARLVMDTLPRWIAPTEPLSAPESKALARLLTTLTTKTMVRVNSAAAELQKPESLVRPFSKHAAYVLTAYVEAVNDPLCIVSSGIRKELQPGLFALCEMLGEHNRDAMMVSALDAGGKATMKMLWKEYEKQRYVGKG